MSEMTYYEHLDWAKQRALQYVDAGNLPDAFASMTSDLLKHDALRDHPGLGLGALLWVGGHLDRPAEMREWIKGFS